MQGRTRARLSQTFTDDPPPPPRPCFVPPVRAGHFEILSKDVGVPLVAFRLTKLVGEDGKEHSRSEPSPPAVYRSSPADNGLPSLKYRWQMRETVVAAGAAAAGAGGELPVCKGALPEGASWKPALGWH